MVYDELIYTPITLTKTDITGVETLPGALVEVMDSEGTLIYREFTDANGEIPDIPVVPGTYTFREAYAPEGYELNTTEMTFTVDELGNITGDTVIRDDYTRVTLVKQDMDGNPLAGVEFGLLRDDEFLVAVAKSDAKGIVTFEQIPFGKYTIREVQPLPGYLLNDTVVHLTVDNTFVNPSEPLAVIENHPIHSTDGTNPHAHILLTGRPLLPDGSWAQKVEKVYICTRNEEQKLILATEYAAARNEGWERQYAYQVGEEKQYMTAAEAALYGYPMKSKEPRSANKLHPLVAQWRSVEQLIVWRKAWADVVNRYLQSAGSSIRIDHRSYKERGIDQIPMIHEGPAARRIEARGGVSRRCEKNRQIRAENARKLGVNTATQ